MTVNPITTAELSRALGCRLEGRPDLLLTGVSTIERADLSELTFLANPIYRKYLPECRAGAIIVPEGVVVPDGIVKLVSADAYRDFRLAVERMYSEEDPDIEVGIHPSAVVHSSALLGENVRLGPYVQIAAGVRIGKNCVLHGGVFVGREAVMGDDCVIGCRVSIRREVQIGNRVRIGDGSVIGYDGFGYTPSPGGYTQIPPVGTVILEDDVHLGACCCIDRATVGITRVGRGSKLDNLIQIAHGVEIGENTVIAAQTGISGSTRIGDWVMMGGQVGLVGHIEIGNHMQIGAQAGVTKSYDIKGLIAGYPARPFMEQRRIEAAVQRLPEILQRLKALEAKATSDTNLEPKKLGR